MNDENNDDISNANGILKWIPTIMLVSVVTGFLALSYYAYNTGRQSVKEDDLLVIEAEKTPMKEKPLDPGGMKFPNQDKTIFETFSNNQAPAKVERVLPAPEEPITKSEVLETRVAENTDTNVDNEEDTSIEVKKVEVAGIDEKKPVYTKYTESKNIEKLPVKSSGIKIQLGAFGSEKEANENWIKIQKKFSNLADKSPIIVRADVKGKIFYRLRVTGFDDINDAKSTCKTLSGKGQACMLAVE